MRLLRLWQDSKLTSCFSFALRCLMRLLFGSLVFDGSAIDLTLTVTRKGQLKFRCMKTETNIIGCPITFIVTQDRLKQIDDFVKSFLAVCED